MLYIRRIVGTSMLPRFLPGQIVVAVRQLRRLRVGQVVILEHEGREKIKRIAKLDGDEVYVLGDHSDSSTDSRHFGWVKLNDIRAVVMWPS